MIVILRGTSGSGKTHLANQIIAAAGPPDEPGLMLTPPNKPPRLGGYTWAARALAVVGRYETACGGCDGFSWPGAADDITALVLNQDRMMRSVLLEGLIVTSWSTKRLLDLQKSATGGLTLINLTTPIEACLDAVAERRSMRYKAKGQEAPPLNPMRTELKHKGLISVTANHRAAGLTVLKLSREEASAQLPGLLGQNKC